MNSRVFLDYSIQKLEQLSGRIAVCLDAMSADQIWSRAGENANAAGNLVLHLCGNVRQWIGSGVGNLPDNRVRDTEFAARGGVSRDELKEKLHSTIEQAVTIIRDVPDSRLDETVTIQGHDVTVSQAIYHVVEHFSGHTGQIIFQAKALTDAKFGFYSYLDKNVKSAEQNVP